MTEKQNNSWIRLYRKIIDNPIYKSSSGIRVWLHCLLSATHTKHKIDFAGEEIELKAGEFVYGRYEWGNATRISPNSIETWINKMVKRNMLYVERRIRGYGSILGISKWGDYQTQRAFKRANNERWVSDGRANVINKNVKNDKKYNNAPASADIVDNLLKEEDKKEKIRYPYQYLGLEIFEKTKAPENKKAECIRLAKIFPQGQIMASLSFSVDYPNPKLRWKMFLWKLHQLKNEKIK